MTTTAVQVEASMMDLTQISGAQAKELKAERDRDNRSHYVAVWGVCLTGKYDVYRTICGRVFAAARGHARPGRAREPEHSTCQECRSEHDRTLQRQQQPWNTDR